MNNKSPNAETDGFDQKVIDALRLGAIFLFVYLSYRIVAPFIPLVLWGAIIAITIYPLHRNLTARLGDRVKLSATLVTLFGIIILVVPVVVLTQSALVSSVDLAEGISEGTVHVPPPPERIQGWPIVGEKLHTIWLLASENLSALVEQFNPQLEMLSGELEDPT